MLNHIFKLRSLAFILTILLLPSYKAAQGTEVSENKKFDLIPISENYLKSLPKDFYIIDSGDSIFVEVSEINPELNVKRLIDGEGTIFLPRLDRIFVRGLTLDELNQLLEKEYSKFLRFPNVRTTIVKYRPIRVYVNGEVETPGLHTLQGALTPVLNNEIDPFLNKSSLSNLIKTKEKGLTTASISEVTGGKTDKVFFPTLYDVIRTAGGLTLYSDLNEIEVIRRDTLSNGGGLKKTYLNLSGLIEFGDVNQNIRIYDGDVIKIKKRSKPNSNKLFRTNIASKFVSVFVSGRVKAPGPTIIMRSSSLNDAISMAGGTRILKGKLTFLRFNKDGNIEKRKIIYDKNAKRGSFSNPYLEDNDYIFVGESFLTASNEVINEITSPFKGLFSTYALIKAISQ